MVTETPCSTAPAEAQGRIGRELLSQGKVEEAITVLAAGAAEAPESPAIHLDLGAALRLAGKRAEAIAALSRALALRPGWPTALYNLASARLESGDTPGALAAFRETVALQPDWSLAHAGLGSALLAGGAWGEAKAELQQALALTPDLHAASHTLGRLQWSCGELEDAVATWQGIGGDLAGCRECHLSLALGLMTCGDYARGWREFEWRWGAGGNLPVLQGLSQPLWDGSPVDGKRVVVWAEQGLGDILMFVRFANLLEQRGATVSILSRPNLDRLLATCPGVDRVSSRTEALADCDYQIPLASLPYLLGIGLADLPAAPAPYLHAPQRLKGDPLGPRRSGALRVGVVWAVEEGHPNWQGRSCPLPAFRVLEEVEGVELYSLQFGPRAAELCQPGAPRMADLSGILGDFAQTAALLDHLDLILTVDTSMAHLAGALGRPVWTLVPYDSDWRWLRGREDSPWYPTMRLFRQAQSRRWEPVVERVVEALREMVRRAAVPAALTAASRTAARSGASAGRSRCRPRSDRGTSRPPRIRRCG